MILAKHPAAANTSILKLSHSITTYLRQVQGTTEGNQALFFSSAAKKLKLGSLLLLFQSSSF